MSLPTEQPCRGCGLSVQKGYPQCPRCKMPLPIAQSPLASTKNGNSGQGGTALQSETGSNTLLIIGAISIAGLLLFLLFRGGSSEPESDEKALETELITDEIQENQVVQEPSSLPPLPESRVGIEVEAEDTVGIQKKRAAIAELSDQLNRSRLWSTLSPLTGSDSTLSIVSGSCEDDTMKPTVQKSATSLRDAGYSEVHCFAKHGELLFKVSL